MEEYKSSSQLLALLMVEVFTTLGMVSQEIKQLLDKVLNLAPKDLQNDQPPLRLIQHHINLILNTALLNLPHYHMNPKKHQIF